MASEHGLLPRSSHEGLSSEVVDLIWLHFLHNTGKAGQIKQVTVVKIYIVYNTKPLKAVIKYSGMTRPTHHSMNRIALLKQKLR